MSKHISSGAQVSLPETPLPSVRLQGSRSWSSPWMSRQTKVSQELNNYVVYGLLFVAYFYARSRRVQGRAVFHIPNIPLISELFDAAFGPEQQAPAPRDPAVRRREPRSQRPLSRVERARLLG